MAALGVKARWVFAGRDPQRRLDYTVFKAEDLPEIVVRLISTEGRASAQTAELDLDLVVRIAVGVAVVEHPVLRAIVDREQDVQDRHHGAVRDTEGLAVRVNGKKARNDGHFRKADADGPDLRLLSWFDPGAPERDVGAGWLVLRADPGAATPAPTLYNWRAKK